MTIRAYNFAFCYFFSDSCPCMITHHAGNVVLLFPLAMIELKTNNPILATIDAWMIMQIFIKLLLVFYFDPIIASKVVCFIFAVMLALILAIARHTECLIISISFRSKMF